MTQFINIETCALTHNVYHTHVDTINRVKIIEIDEYACGFTHAYYDVMYNNRVVSKNDAFTTFFDRNYARGYIDGASFARKKRNDARKNNKNIISFRV